jgi:transcriptional regulator with XRE-family HTH domain
MPRDDDSDGARVRWAKEQSGRTWQQLGTAVGCSHAALVQWSRGQTALGNAKVRLVVAFARETGVNVSWLLTGDGPAISSYQRLDPVVQAAELLLQERPALASTGAAMLEALRGAPTNK